MNKRTTVISFLLMLGLALTLAAQYARVKEESITSLKQQLTEVESKETQLRLRLEELEEQLKPECIKRALAGIGSTHPEELRERRRKLLTIERNGLQAQLDLLEESRSQIEAAITAVEAATYLKYAQPSQIPSAPL